MAGRGRAIRRLGQSKPTTPGIKSQGRCMAKFSYQGNPDTPGGFKEINMKQGEYLTLISKGHQDNPHWWLVRKDDNTEGYVPGDYLMELEATASSLPWLTSNNKDKENDNASPGNMFGRPKFKEYKSAYGNNKDKKEYFCEICSREFNGPTPYRAHMNSKTHREEMEIAKQYGRA